MAAELANRPMFIGTQSHLLIYVLSIAPFMLQQDRAVYCHRELKAHKAQNIYHLSLDLKKSVLSPVETVTFHKVILMASGLLCISHK